MTRAIAGALAERGSEAVFVGALIVGSTLLALGSAFLVLGLTVTTHPPAPYLPQPEKYLLAAGSAVTAAVGFGILRWALGSL